MRISGLNRVLTTVDGRNVAGGGGPRIDCVRRIDPLTKHLPLPLVTRNMDEGRRRFVLGTALGATALVAGCTNTGQSGDETTLRDATKSSARSPSEGKRWFKETVLLEIGMHKVALRIDTDGETTASEVLH